MLHASRFGQGLPVGANLGQVRQLERHAQADLAQFGMIVDHVLHDLFALFGCEVIVLEQIALAEDLAYAEYLVARGIECQVQEVAA